MSSRRDFLELAGAALLAPVVSAAAAAAAGPSTTGSSGSGPGSTGSDGGTRGILLPRTLGKTGVQVSGLGVGGYHLGTMKSEAEAVRLVHEAIDAGLTFFDNAWEYNEGRSEQWLGKALEGKRQQVFLMTKVCTHGRDKRVAMQQLEESLRRLRTDHLDLWQVHEVVHDNDPALHYQKGGVLEALEEAKRQGKVRFVGFTGHKDPAIHLDMLQRGFPFDSVQMPLNAFDATFRSFEQRVLPEVLKRGMVALGMKSLGGEGDPVKKGALAPEEALRYALSLPAHVIISGMDKPEVLRQNLKVARDFKPMSAEEMRALRERCRQLAADGRFELYKTSMKYDADVGRAQHGLPSMKELGG
ncbi:aldo/keto reductase [Simulacricoccus sp. 17bor-14]|uniref:aldo/keto reductase n=1 Tax=Myxococcaceae TaxID=31 RepID=UPI00188FBD8F|nr:aldo/keto reductase [Simulacricoccus sp. 17bor-14]